MATRTVRIGRSTAIKSVVVVIVVAVVAGVWWWHATRGGLHLSAKFSATVGVYAGSDVRILGVPVGKVEAVDPHGTYVTVSMHLDPGVRVRADTYAVIVSPNLVSDRYVQLTGAYKSGPKLADHATLGRSRTRTPVELDELYRNLTKLTDALGPNGANSDGALNRLLRTGAANLGGGNGKKLNDTITALSRSGRTLDDSKDDIFATIDQLSKFTTTLKDHDTQLTSANGNFAAVSQALADDSKKFGQALHELAGALSLVQKFVHDNRAALTSNVGKLDQVAQTLDKRRDGLAQALRSAPLLIQNFLNAYDPDHNLLRGRADLNELTVWANQNSGGSNGASAGSSAAPSGSASAAAAPAAPPPLLLPAADNRATGP